MKTKLLLIVVLIFPIIALGQITHKNVDEVKVTPPVFTGIQQTADVSERIPTDPLGAYLAENFKYPNGAAECRIEGTGIVKFLVKSDGKLTDFEVVNGVCPTIDKEFVRVLKTTEGMWNPGYNNDVATAMKKEVSMLFVVTRENETDPVEYFYSKSKNLFSRGNKLFLVKGKPKKALNYYERTVKLMPYETSSLLLRGLCRYELGDEEGACSDWNRINAIGKYDADPYLENLCGLKGYAEMSQILDINQK